MTAMTDNQMKDYLKNLDNFDKFIFDLRGDSKMSEHILSLFTNQPLNTVNWEIPTYTFPDKLNKSKEIIAGEILPKSKLLNKALLFLINERTTGYSEIIAKIVKDNNLGKLLGNPSMGNASETFTVRLAGGFAISLSGMICIDTNDKMIFNNPILPDIYTKESMDNVKANKDVIIQTALKFVKE